MGLAGGVELVELASGVDSFYMSGRGALDGDRYRQLSDARDLARESRSGTPIQVGEDTFIVSGRGINRFEFRLDHPHGIIGVSPSAAVPTVHVQPKAAFIHGSGIWPALKWFMHRSETLVGPVCWQASRIDLFMDSHGWEVSSRDLHRFLCRSTKTTVHEEDGCWQTFRFGMGGSPVSARIYDKTQESRLKGTDWWLDVWGEGYRPGERVVRVEFQLMREALREAGVNSPETGLERIGELWGYLTDSWLTLRDPTNDATKSRWPVAQEWTQIQQASLRLDVAGLERVRAGQVNGNLRKLMPALRGYLATGGALLGATSLEETFALLRGPIEAYGESSGKPFVSLLDEKRRAVGA